MLINISEILSNPSVEKEYIANLDSEYIYFKKGSFPVSRKESFPVSLKNEDGKLHVTLSTEVEVVLPCDKCLDEVPFTYPVSIDYILDPDINTDDNHDDDDFYIIDGCILDVDKLILDEIVVALPTKVLCKEDCKGLCNICGTNLNHHSCDCDREIPDPRMAAIRDIFQNFQKD